MSLHESRLRAMLDVNGLGYWALNDEDREAIAWALDAIEKLKAERDGLREEYSQGMHAAYERWNVARAAAEQLARVFDATIGGAR